MLVRFDGDDRHALSLMHRTETAAFSGRSHRLLKVCGWRQSRPVALTQSVRVCVCVIQPAQGNKAGLYY